MTKARRRNPRFTRIPAGIPATAGRHDSAGDVFFDRGGVTIGDNVLIGPKVDPVTPDRDLRPGGKRKSMFPRHVVVGNSVRIGIGAAALPGVAIGENAAAAETVPGTTPPGWRRNRRNLSVGFKFRYYIYACAAFKK